MGELVTYHNEFNNIPLRNFSEKELNVFFTILYKAKNEGLNIIKIDFNELRKLSNGDVNNPRFIKALDNVDRKLLLLNQKIKISEGVTERFNLFNTFRIDENKKILEIEIHRNFKYILNDLDEYTKFELKQLVGLKSSYSKNVFRLLKQFDGTRMKILFLEDFKRILCIPNTYKMCDIDKNILTPIKKELTTIFPRLKIEKIKKGRSVDKLIFTWGNRNILNGEIAPGVQPKKVEEIEISEGLNKAIEKAKKNRFINFLMTIENIEKLLKIFGDQELTKGLYFASSEINIEIKSLTYIINSINMGLEKNTKKIVVKEVKSKDLQGVELDEEKKEELTEEIRKPKNEELKEFINEVRKIGRKKLKDIKYYKFMGELQLCMSFEKVNELILKYELNGTLENE